MSVVLSIGNANFGDNALYKIKSQEKNMYQEPYTKNFIDFTGGQSTAGGFILTDLIAIPEGYDYLNGFVTFVTLPDYTISNGFVSPYSFYDSEENFISGSARDGSLRMKYIDPVVDLPVYQGDSIAQRFIQGYLCEPIPSGAAFVRFSLFTPEGNSGGVYEQFNDYKIPLINNNFYFTKRISV